MAEFIDTEALASSPGLSELFDQSPGDLEFIDDGSSNDGGDDDPFNCNILGPRTPRNLSQLLRAPLFPGGDGDPGLYTTEEISPQLERVSISCSGSLAATNPARKKLRMGSELVDSNSNSSDLQCAQGSIPNVGRSNAASTSGNLSMGFRNHSSFDNILSPLDGGPSPLTTPDPPQTSNATEEARGSQALQDLALAKFKQGIGLSWNGITRKLIRNDTKKPTWCGICLEDNREKLKKLYENPVIENAIDGLAMDHCSFFQIELFNPKTRNDMLVMLSEVGINGLQLEPPNIHTDMNILAWQSFTRVGKGQVPSWMRNKYTAALSVDGAKLPDFKVKTAAQFCIDNGITDLATFTYKYALLAVTDPNAKAWLDSNSCVKWANDTIKLAQLLEHGRKAMMTVGEYCCERMEIPYEGESKNYTKVDRLLLFNGILPVAFANSLRKIIHRTPKKSVLVLCGDRDTGKSVIASSLAKFFGGKSIGFQNANSSFWLQPAVHAKMVILDDATMCFWDYANKYLRTAFDGGEVSVDIKHQAVKQTQFPPWVITTNYDISDVDKYGDSYKYLINRVIIHRFNKRLTEGITRLLPGPGDWADWFLRYAQNLDIEDDVAESGEAVVDLG
ncbi:E1 protein [Papillomaviridae sp. Haddock_c45]|nr:E1 protein [Papillomaviridae sp. Haddock_c45]